jgi:hypothetical protein
MSLADYIQARDEMRRIPVGTCSEELFDRAAKAFASLTAEELQELRRRSETTGRKR